MRHLLSAFAALIFLLIPTTVQEAHLTETYTSPTAQAYGHFGETVTDAGDVNGDSKTDLLVGAYGEKSGKHDGAGRAYLISGATGDVLRSLTPPSANDAGWFGRSVAQVGDTDGDGIPDLLVGAPGESPGGIDSAGRAYLFSGATGEVIQILTSLGATKEGGFGTAVAGVGDVNEDGTPDLLIGAKKENANGYDEAGRAYVFSGATGEVIYVLTSPYVTSGDGYLGTAVDGAGDVNGDGTPDLLVSATGEEGSGYDDAGRVYLFSGANGKVIRTLTSPNPEKEGLLGWSLAQVGDANADGVPDLLVGSDESHGGVDGAGRAYLFSGATGGVIQILSSPNEQGEGGFGHAVAGTGDVNEDGIPDLLIGAPGETADGLVFAGRAYLFSGATGKMIEMFVSPKGEYHSAFGRAVAGVSDARGNGRVGVLIGSPHESLSEGSRQSGRVYHFRLKETKHHD